MGELVRDPTSERVELDEHSFSFGSSSIDMLSLGAANQSLAGLDGVGMGSASYNEPDVQTKLKWAKEYINRKIVSLIATKRKTEHVCVITVGDRTNNPHAESGYDHIDILFAPTTAADWMVEKVLDVRIGHHQADVLGALLVSLDVLASQPEWRKNSWMYEIHAVTDGESEFGDDLLDDLKAKLPKVPAVTIVVGFGFSDKTWVKEGGLVSHIKSQNKSTNEGLLAALRRHVRDPPKTSSDTARTFKIASASRALLAARFPAPKIVKPTNKSLSLRIGGGVDNDDGLGSHGIEIAVKMGKMTAVAQPPGLKKLAVRYNPLALAELKSDSQLQKSRRLDQQLQSSYNVSQTQNSSSASYPYPETNITSGAHRLVSTPILPDVISGPLRNITKYRLQIPDPTSSEAPASSSITSTSAAAAEAPGALPSPSASFPPPPKEELIEKEKLTRAYKLGSSWVPVEEEDELTAGKAGMSVGGRFETKKGLDVFSFLYAANFDRSLAMSEVYAVYPLPTSSRSQIEFSSLIQAMLHHPKGEMHVLLRVVTEDGLPPKLFVGKAVENEVGQEYMNLTRMPFADDYTNALFPSLENVKSRQGMAVEKHANIPTTSQQDAMDEFVAAMDLSEAREESSSRLPWFTPEDSYKPSIHRMKDAIYFQMTGDVEAGDRIAPPHPELTRYFEPPREVIKDLVESGIDAKLVEAMGVKKVPSQTLKRNAANGNETEATDDFGDLDDLLRSSDALKTPLPAATPIAAVNLKSLPNRITSITTTPVHSHTDYLVTSPSSAKRRRTTLQEDSERQGNDTTMLDADQTIADDQAEDSSGTEDDDGDEEEEAPDRVDGQAGDTRVESLYRGQNPVTVFERTLKTSLGRGEGVEDRLPQAMNGLTKAILEMIGQGDSYHSLAYTSLQHLRRRSLSLEEPLLFNSFLYSLKARARAEPSVAAFWKYLREGDRDKGDGGRGRRQEGVGLIRFEEDVVARESKVSEMEARQFWEGL